MNLSHPLRVTFRQIVIDGNDMYALAFQSIQIRRQQAGLCLTFTGPHLGNTPLMQHDTADQLHTVVLRLQDPAGRLPHRGISLRQQTVQRLAVLQSLSVFFRLIAQLLVRQFHHAGAQALDLIDQTADALDLPLTMRSKHFLYYTHDRLVSVYRMPCPALRCTTYLSLAAEITARPFLHIGMRRYLIFSGFAAAQLTYICTAVFYKYKIIKDQRIL